MTGSPIGLRRAVAAALCVSAAQACGSGEADQQGAGRRILVYTRATGFQHGSIPAGLSAIRELGAGHGFAVDAGSDPALLEAGRLRRYQAVVFLSTTGDPVARQQRASLQQWVTGGGGVVAIHGALDAEYDWPFWGELLGGWFTHHPPVQEALLVVADSADPATRGLPSAWRWRDEWYDLRPDPTATSRVLLTVAESTYSGGRMGSPHPVTWTRTVGEGRVWVTTLGHEPGAYADTLFRRHLLEGVRWSARW